MSSYSWMKRLLAVVLAFSMTLGVVPANAVDALTAEAEPENSLGGIDALIQPAETFTAYESDLFVAEEEETVEVDPETVSEEELLPDEEEQEELELLDVEYTPLSGKVLDTEGNGLAGVTVAIFDFELNEVLAHVTTNGSGTWSFGEAQVGLSYQVSYYCPGYTMEPRTESFEAVSGAIQLEDVTASKRAVFDGVSTPESQFTYTIQDSYYATITGYTGSDSVVVIPEKLAEGTLTVRAIAGKVFYNRATLTAVSLPAAVVSIGDSAFAGCSNLEFIDLPNTVSSIGSYAFQNCTKLTEIELPDSVSDLGQRVFAGCTALELVDYPAGLKSVDYWGGVFKDCTNLKSITIPEGVTFLPNNVFESASYLEEVILPSTLTKIGEDAFKDCVKLQAPELPEGLATIGASAFSGCSAMTAVTFPKSLTAIGGSAFNKCTGLTEVSFQEGITNLDSYAFQKCTALTEVQLPDSITTLGQRVFEGCSALESINYPKSLNKVDSWGGIFENCASLKSITVPEGVAVLADNVFKSSNYLEEVILPSTLTRIGAQAFYGCVKLQAPELPEGLATIGASAFAGNTAMKSIAFPESLTAIGGSAFDKCTGLTEVSFQEGITNLDSYAFQKCTALTEVQLPDSITTLGQRVFEGCTALESINYPKSLNKVDSWGGIFENCSSLKTITVPEGVTVLADNVFESSNYLEEVILPSTLTRIGADALKGCVKLQAPELPEGLATIGASAFSGNTAMKSIAFPKSLTAIGGSAFDKCTGLTEVSFQEGITSLDSYAFRNCTGLTKLVLPDSITTLGQRVFAGCAYLRSINYPKSLNKVDSWGGVFEDCVRLRTVSVPEGVTILPDNAFEAANYLRNIILPASLKTIGAEAFKGCVRLRSVDIMEGLTTIRSSAFMGCTNLEGLYLPGTVIAYGEDVFANCPSLVVECKEYSRAIIYCMKNSIPVKFIPGNLEDESNLFLDRDKTYYTANAAGALANGYVTINLGYGFKETAGAVSNIQLDILLPKGNTIMPDTLRLNGKLVTDDNNDDVNIGDILDSQNVKLTLGENEGELSFCLRPIAGTELNSYAVLTYTMDGTVHEEIIGCINDVVSVLTIQASAEVSEKTVTVTGAGPMDGQVDIYVDGVHAATAYTYKSGRYSTTVTLPDPEDYKSYTLSARAVDADGTTATVQQTVRYVEGTPELTRFLVSYGERIYNAMDPNQQHPLIVYEGTVWDEEWAKFGFEVSFDNNEAVDKVYICSTRNGVTKRLPATWNEDKKAFTVRDMFEPGNPYYIPGTMTVEYTRPEPTLDFNQGVDFTSARYVNAASEVIQNALERKAEEYLTLSNNSKDLLKGTIALTDVDAMLDFDIATKMLPEYLNKLNAEQYGYQAMTDDMGYQLFIKVADVGEDHLRAEIVDFGKETVVDVLIDGGFGNAAASLDSAFAFADALGYADTLLTWDNNRVSLKQARQAILSSSMSPAEKAEALKQIEYAEKSNHGVVACMGLQILLAAAGVALPFPVSMVLPLIALQNSNFVDQILGGTGGDHDYMKGTSLLDAIMDAIFKIDPSGIVYDSETGEPIEGVTTTAYWISYEESGPDAKPSDDQYGTIWDAEPYEEKNPLSTDSRGYYAWDVPEGWWRVKAEHPDYETVWSEWLPVAPPQTEVDLAMKRVIPRDLYEFTVESKEYNFISASVSTSVTENVSVIVLLAVYDSNDRLVGITSGSGALNENQPLDVEVRLEEDAIPAYSKTFLLDSTTYAPLRSPWIKAW